MEVPLPSGDKIQVNVYPSRVRISRDRCVCGALADAVVQVGPLEVSLCNHHLIDALIDAVNFQLEERIPA